jgi:hypothetical protein
MRKKERTQEKEYLNLSMQNYPFAIRRKKSVSSQLLDLEISPTLEGTHKTERMRSVVKLKTSEECGSCSLPIRRRIVFW